MRYLLTTRIFMFPHGLQSYDELLPLRYILILIYQSECASWKCVAWWARVWVTHINVFNTPFTVLGIGICYLAITRSFVWKHLPCEHLHFFPYSFPFPVFVSFYGVFLSSPLMGFICLWLIEWMNELTLFILDSSFNIKFVFKSAVLLCNLI